MIMTMQENPTFYSLVVWEALVSTGAFETHKIPEKRACEHFLKIPSTKAKKQVV